MPLPLHPSLLDWGHDKAAIQTWTGLHDDTLHMGTGMLILTVAALVTQRPPWTLRPWLAVLIAETVNELYDLTASSDPRDEGNFPDSWHDFWLTLLWPTVILLIYRRWGARARSDAGKRY